MKRIALSFPHPPEDGFYWGGCDGQFYLSKNHCLNWKYDQETGKKQMMIKTKKEIKRELKKKGHAIRGHCGENELEDLAKRNDILLT